MNSWLTVLSLGFAAFVAGGFAMRWLGRGAKKELAVYEERVARIRSLPNAEAETTARSLLDGGGAFTVTTASKEFQPHASLPDGVKKLFEAYERIEMTAWPYAVLDRKMVRSSAIDSTYICIGAIARASDMEGEIGILPGQEPVCEIHSGEAPDPRLGMFPTVYHWLIAAHEERAT
jgi:hypothetical protein